MPFPMKIQPIDCYTREELSRYEAVKPVVKSRLKRLFEFSSFLRVSAVDRAAGIYGPDEFEPNSVSLDKMVQNFIEDSNERQCGRSMCFNGDGDDDSQDDLDAFNCFGNPNHNSSNDACELLKTLVVCASVSERNLLADVAKIVEKSKVCKDGFGRNFVVESLISCEYDASVCRSHWEKSPSFPAGEYEYVDVIIGGERLIIDIDFRSEFEIARSTKRYRLILQTLPQIFVGKTDRLQRIIQVVSEAAKQSLKKKGMHFPPWRKADYVKAKWLSPHTHTRTTPVPSPDPVGDELGESGPKFDIGKKEMIQVVVKQREPPKVKPKGIEIDCGVKAKATTGLSSVIEDEP